MSDNMISLKDIKSYLENLRKTGIIRSQNAEDLNIISEKNLGK